MKNYLMKYLSLLFLAFLATVSAFMPGSLHVSSSLNGGSSIMKNSIRNDRVRENVVKASVFITVGDGENIDNAMRRFKREVNRCGHLMDLRWKRYHETSQEKKKRKTLNARRKARIIRSKLRKSGLSM